MMMNLLELCDRFPRFEFSENHYDHRRDQCRIFCAFLRKSPLLRLGPVNLKMSKILFLKKLRLTLFLSDFLSRLLEVGEVTGSDLSLLDLFSFSSLPVSVFLFFDNSKIGFSQKSIR